MKEFKSLTEEINYWSGYLLIKIGEGDFRGGVNLMIQTVTRESYESGFKQGLKQGREEVIKTLDSNLKGRK
jgi:hypothetical protein